MEKVADVILAFRIKKQYDELLDVILSKMMEITGSDGGTLYILDEDKLQFRIIRNTSLGVFQSVKDLIELPHIPLDSSKIEHVSAWVAINGQALSINDVYNNSDFNFAGPREYDRITGYHTKSMLVLPLISLEDEGEEVLGVIQLINAKDPKTGEICGFGDVLDSPVIPSLANIAANTLANFVHMRDTRMLFHSIIAMMTQAVEERSEYNGSHVHNVAHYCESFAHYLGQTFPPKHPLHFNKSRTEQLSMAALLHDIGKLVTPLHVMDKDSRLGPKLEVVRHRFEIKRHQLEIDLLKGVLTGHGHQTAVLELEHALDILEKANTSGVLSETHMVKVRELGNIFFRDEKGRAVPIIDDDEIESLTIPKGTLTAAERAIMQEHAALTGRLLDKIPNWKYYKNIPEWARNHHELLDGSGYPLGLRGSELSHETCILTIIDIFESLTASDRPYKKSMTPHDALRVLTAMAQEGKLHGELVDLFVKSGVWQQETTGEG